MTTDTRTHPDHETLPLPYSMTPEAIERETKMVHLIVSEIAEALAKAFLAMPATGLLNTRYTCYCDAVAITLKNNVIPFHYHKLDLAALIERCWINARDDV